MRSRPNITIPKDPWAGEALADGGGDQALSPEAQAIRSLALTFPVFRAPGLQMLEEYHKYSVVASGSPYRPYGPKKIKRAIAELKRRGFYAIRRASLGRRPDGTAEMAFSRLYVNVAHVELHLLDSLTDDEVRRHSRAVKTDWEHWIETGIWPGFGSVISLDEHRAAKAG